MGDERICVDFTVIGFDPKRSFNNARSGVHDIQLVWDRKCSDLIQKHRRTLGKHRASWPDSELRVGKKPVAQ